MNARVAGIKRDVQYVWGFHERYPMFGRVLKVAKDGSWVDVRLYTWMFTWTHRYYMDQSGATVLDARYQQEWTQEDVSASAPRPVLVSMGRTDG